MDLAQNLIDIPKIDLPKSFDYIAYQIETENNRQGDLSGYECSACQNRGYFAVRTEDDNMAFKDCKCMKIRMSLRNIENSGLSDVIKKNTFDRYTENEPWQAYAKKLAIEYTKINSNLWLYVAGQSGVGKTHLCTAICSGLLNNGRVIKYALWRDVFRELDSLKYKYDERQQKLDKLKNIDVLYIDDFLKNYEKKANIDELNIAYEVINLRYIADKKTIISSEHISDRLLEFDTALGGRIIEKSKMIQIREENGRNYRTK